jgi:hypothetical protein
MRAPKQDTSRHDMDANEFLKKITPEGKKSKLAPWLKDLQKLQAAGCSNAQLQQFLKVNNVEASISSIQKYLWRMTKEIGNEFDGKSVKESEGVKELLTKQEGRNNDGIKQIESDKKPKSFEEIQKEVSNFKRENEDE